MTSISLTKLKSSRIPLLGITLNIYEKVLKKEHTVKPLKTEYTLISQIAKYFCSLLERAMLNIFEFNFRAVLRQQITHISTQQ